MIRAFLSHSSKDKGRYVRELANQLGKENIVYDEFTFEEGEKTLDEILEGLDKSQLFVLLISDSSLVSEWVQREINEAKRLNNQNKIEKVFPIIIDENITHEDPRIPDWLRVNYNLKPIMRPKVAARRINNKLRELSWSRHPELKKRNTVFVGRNDKLEQFEERIHDFDRDKPLSIVVSGFSGVGRRTFLHRALTKVNITDMAQKPSSLLLDRNVSIEDFILKLNDLGLLNLEEEVQSLTDKTIDEKVSIIHRIMDAAYDANELIYLVDDGCLVNFERKLTEWFSKAINNYKRTGHPIFCIASKYKVRIAFRPKNDRHYFVELNELNINERKRLFAQLLEIYKINIEKKEFEEIVDLLFGFPDQVMFAVDIARDPGPITDKLPIITEYNTDKASALLRKYEKNEKSLDFIRLLAQFEVISSDFIYSIVPESDYYPLVEELAAEHVVELIGIDGEILRLNDIVRDYIKRNRLGLNPNFAESIQQQVEAIIESDDIFERESSEFIFSLKEALKTNKKIDEKLLIPSHYLRCMKDLYYSKGSLDRIIELADIILQKEKTLEFRVSQDIRYYLCLALARKKDSRLLNEVQKINGNEHIFLLGYYYRLCGRLKDAKVNFEKIIDDIYVGARAKREIVQVYVQLEEYEKALLFAKRNYEENRGNQFHTQAYFNCLINSDEPVKHKNVLSELIQNLNRINSEQSREMAEIAEALFVAKVSNEKQDAIDKIMDCVHRYPDNHYPLLAMCDIALKYNDVKLLNEGCEKLTGLSKKKQLSLKTMNRYLAYQHAYDGNLIKAIQTVEIEIQGHPIESREKIINRLREISQNYSTQKSP